MASRQNEANILNWNIAKSILIERANGHEVTEDEMIFLASFLNTELSLSKEMQEDVGLMLEHFLVQNDLAVFDDMLFYSELMTSTAL